jgi:hypothetical protein
MTMILRARPIGAFLLTSMLFSAGCQEDPQLPRLQRLLIDNFENPPGASCGLNARCFSSDPLAVCDADAALNMRSECPNISCDSENNGNPNGSICASYAHDESGGGLGTSLELFFDVSTVAQAADDAFAWLDEDLTQPGSNGTRQPLNLKELELGHLTFWIRTTVPNTNMEISVKDSKGAETSPKMLLSDVLPGGGAGQVWQKVSIPVSSLSQGRTASVAAAVDMSSLMELNLAFAHTHFTQTDPTTVLKGILFVDEIAFEQ